MTPGARAALLTEVAPVRTAGLRRACAVGRGSEAVSSAPFPAAAAAELGGGGGGRRSPRSGRRPRQRRVRPAPDAAPCPSRGLRGGDPAPGGGGGGGGAGLGPRKGGSGRPARSPRQGGGRAAGSGRRRVMPE
nr:uncharacterized protein LOC111769311 isoform X2 [Equus caballus]